MKKLKLTGLVTTVVITMFLMFSCGKGVENTPSAVSVAAIKCLANADIDGLLELMYIPENVNIDIEEKKDYLEKDYKPDIDEDGGLKSVEVIKETIAEDGKTAKVVIRLTYGNGDEDIETANLIKLDGKWKYICFYQIDR